MKTHRSRKCISLSYHEITETSSRHLEWLKKNCAGVKGLMLFFHLKNIKICIGPQQELHVTELQP